MRIVKSTAESARVQVQVRLVSLDMIADFLDGDRQAVRQALHRAGVFPVLEGEGAQAAIRYAWHEVEGWLRTTDGTDLLDDAGGDPRVRSQSMAARAWD